MRNSNEIYLKKQFDFENVTQRIFDFNVLAYNHDHEENKRHVNHRSLDQTSHHLNLELDSESFNAFYSTARVILIINDLNDETPRFLLKGVDYSFDLYSNKIGSGTKVGQVFAFDADMEDQDSLVFEIDPANNGDRMFSLTQVKTNENDGILLPQMAMLTTKTELSPAKYELILSVKDKVNHITKTKVFINFKLRDPPLPSIKWFKDDNKIVKNNLLVIRSTKTQIISSENKKVLTLIAKLDNSQVYRQSQLRYKQMDDSTLFKINELTGDLFYTDDLIKENDRQTNVNVLIQAYYLNDKIHPNQVYDLSQIMCVRFILDDNLGNSVPKFLLPINNHTIVDLKLAGKTNDSSRLSDEYIFKFKALDGNDLAIEDSVEYELVESVILRNYTAEDILEYDEENIAQKLGM